MNQITIPAPLDSLDEAPLGLIAVGEHCTRQLRYSRDDIVAFARLSGDSNPLHHDTAAAQRADFGEIIASGQQTASQLMGLVASHFSQPHNGRPRSLLCLNFNFAFKHPIFAEQTLELRWRVTDVEPGRRRGGQIAHLEGSATVAGRACVVGRGTLLVLPD